MGDDQLQRGVVRRAAWIVLGSICVAIGGVGIVVPGLPTTVFFIAAAACFTRSSPRLEAWVLGLPTIGPAVRDYRAGLGMPRRAKIFAISMIVVFVALSAFVLRSWWWSSVVVVAGIVGILYIVRVPTKGPSAPAPP